MCEPPCRIISPSRLCAGHSFRRAVCTRAAADSRIAATITPTEISPAGVVRAVAVTKTRFPMRNLTLAFISSGGSKYPIELLKEAGVDMTTDEPLELTMKEMNRVMDEMEAILAKRSAPAGR